MTGEQMQTEREQHGMPRAYLARQFGVDPATIEQWERNDVPLDPQVQRAFYKALEQFQVDHETYG